MTQNEVFKEIILPEPRVRCTQELEKSNDIAFGYFSQRWPNIPLSDIQRIITSDLLPALNRDINSARLILGQEVEVNQENMIYVQNHIPDNLKVKLFLRELLCFIKWDGLESFISFEENLLQDLMISQKNGGQQIPYLTMPTFRVLEKIEDVVKQHLLMEIDLSGELNLVAFVFNAKFLMTDKFKNDSNSLFQETLELICKLSQCELRKNPKNGSHQNTISNTEWTDVAIDIVHLLILRKIEPTKPTKTTKASTERLISTVMEIKDCFLYISKIQSIRSTELQEILKKLNHEKVELEKQVMFVKDSRDKGRNNRHDISRKYKSIIEGITENSYSLNPNISFHEIMESESIQNAIKACKNEQTYLGRKPFQAATFEKYLRNKLRTLKSGNGVQMIPD